MSAKLDLESTLADAAIMARVTVEFIGQALHVDKADGPPLTDEARTQLSFVVLQTCRMIEAARDAFYASLEK